MRNPACNKNKTLTCIWNQKSVCPSSASRDCSVFQVGIMVFECQQCGECCSQMGVMYQIEEECGPYSFRVRNQYTGDRYLVTILPMFHTLYLDKEIFKRFSDACPFLREGDDGLCYCTIHLTRPDVCREFECCRFLILDSSGERAGRVMGNRHLSADCPHLQSVWDTCISLLDEDDNAIWDKKMCDIIRNAGYKIRG